MGIAYGSGLGLISCCVVWIELLPWFYDGALGACDSCGGLFELH